MSTDYRIMLADDEELELRVLETVIRENFGDRLTVVKASDGMEAIQAYRKKPADIAVLDIEMPVADGITVAQNIRAVGLPCQIVFLTAYDDFAYMKEAIHVKALDYLLKPFDEQEFVMLVEEALHQAERPQERGAGEGPRAGERPERGGEETDGQERRIVSMIRNYLEENYMNPISMQETARVMNYSEVYFCKLFKQFFSVNFTTYLTRLRIQKAKEILEDPTVTVKEAGRAVGYPDQNYFTRAFKRICGCSPGEYRRNSERV